MDDIVGRSFELAERFSSAVSSGVAVADAVGAGGADALVDVGESKTSSSIVLGMAMLSVALGDEVVSVVVAVVAFVVVAAGVVVIVVLSTIDALFDFRASGARVMGILKQRKDSKKKGIRRNDWQTTVNESDKQNSAWMAFLNIFTVFNPFFLPYLPLLFRYSNVLLGRIGEIRGQGI